MSAWKTLTGTTALAALAMAGPAAADVTPEQVWQDLKAYLEGFGYEMSATENMSGDTLTVSDVTMAIPMPEDDVEITVVMPELTFDGNDGAVDLTWPEQMPVTITVDEAGEMVEVTLLYETSDGLATVSGDPGDTAWEYGAASIRLTLDKVFADGLTVPPEIARGEIAMTGLSGTSAMKTGEMREITQSMSVDSLTYDIAARDPESADNTLTVVGNLDDVTYEGGGTMPLAFDAEDPMAMMRALDVDGAFTYGGGSTQFNAVDGGEAVKYASSSSGGNFSVTLTPETWLYDVLVTGYDVQMEGGDIPFPVALKASELGGKFTLPVARTEEPVDVAAGLTLTEFEMNDMIWSMIDPGAQLPRDPATIQVDLTGKARMLFDMFDPEQAQAMAMAPMPAELHALTLNSLVVDAVGAMLTGNGSFTFDNSDMQTIPGMPRPEGTLNAELTGANALLDKLVAMGLIPEDQAMGARMMMSMFSVAAGDDKLKSTIEVNDKGHILANGQRIQ